MGQINKKVWKELNVHIESFENNCDAKIVWLECLH